MLRFRNHVVSLKISPDAFVCIFVSLQGSLDAAFPIWICSGELTADMLSERKGRLLGDKQLSKVLGPRPPRRWRALLLMSFAGQRPNDLQRSRAYVVLSPLPRLGRMRHPSPGQAAVTITLTAAPRDNPTAAPKICRSAEASSSSLHPAPCHHDHAVHVVPRHNPIHTCSTTAGTPHRFSRHPNRRSPCLHLARNPKRLTKENPCAGRPAGRQPPKEPSNANI